MSEISVDSKKYVLITSARNEEAYIEKVIQSVIKQTIWPQKYVIVSDGSTDRTDEIVNSYVKDYDFLQLLHVRREGKRNFGSMADAFNEGYIMLKHTEYDFIGNLDADISFNTDYFERILEEFQRNKKMGLAGGFIYEEYNGKFQSRKFNSMKSVPHAVQLFRRGCYEEIGSFIPLKYGGTDWCAEIMVRMNGWDVVTFPELQVFHHRRTSGVTIRDNFRHGLKDYSIGSHPLFEIFKCIYRIKGKPFLVGAFVRMAGFTWAYCRREKRMISDEIVRYLRKEQMQRVYELFGNIRTHK